MTRTGIVLQRYSDCIEPRPYSRFTALDHEQAANDEWLDRALTWGRKHIDKHGHWIGKCKHIDFEDNLTGSKCLDCGLEVTENE